MAQQNLDLGTYGDVNTGEFVGESLIKVEANFTDLYTNKANDSEVVHNTGNETITGNKTFNSTGLFIQDTVNSVSPKLNFANYVDDGTFNGSYNRLYWKDSKLYARKLGQSSSDGALIIDQNNTAERTYLFPNKSGTVALLDDIGDFTTDLTPLDGSPNVVESNGIYDALVNIGSYAADGTIHGIKMSDSSISYTKLVSGIPGSYIQSTSITSAQLATNAITKSKVSDNAIGPAELDDSINGSPNAGEVLGYDGTNFEWVTAALYTSGTFTPNILDLTGGATYSFATRYGKYAKVNNLCHFEIYMTGITTSGTPGSNDDLVVTGLPFAKSSNTRNVYPVRINFTDKNFYSINASHTAGETYMTLEVLDDFNDGGNNITLDSVTFSNGSLTITGSYITA